ncbi:2-phosphosulfolactate phosphatase [Nocardia sp. NPDC005366]|uniref:2-phosphosulfolactate phosphatase n=1 Tax=Nocardia sp. NPDC005366 TaxID=3156878 RepID=UPI0033B9607C
MGGKPNTPAIPDWSTQRPWGVRIDWGAAGARALGPDSAVVVVVDVLSFTTSVSVAVDAGTRVLPYRWRDRTAEEYAAANHAELAVGRRAVSARQPWSLSPAALRRAPAPERLVLPSPNGSAISAAVSGIPVVAACLRNASAVARWISAQGWGTEQAPVSVIAAVSTGRVRMCCGPRSRIGSALPPSSRHSPSTGPDRCHRRPRSPTAVTPGSRCGDADLRMCVRSGTGRARIRR